MKINKKLISLSISISLLTPLIALACTAKVTKKPNKPSDKATEQKEKELLKLANGKTKLEKPKVDISKEPNASRQVKEIYDAIFLKYQEFTKIKVFAPKSYLNSNRNEIKYQYRQKDSNTFNATFFKDVSENLYDSNYVKNQESNRPIKISSKTHFDQYIINRFKELNTYGDFNDDLQIKSLFEELYLNNQDVYQLLQENNIYIYQTSKDNYKPEGEFIVPLYKENKLTINILYDLERSDLNPTPKPLEYAPPSEVAVQYWEVFVVKKTQSIEYNKIARDNYESVALYKQRLEKWFEEEFKNNNS